MTTHVFSDEPYGDENAVFRGRPLPVPKVKPIASNARLLRPTAASLRRMEERPPRKGKARLTDDMDKENVQPNRQRRRKPLTIPKSPKFQPTRRVPPRDRLLTKTSRELREIEAIRKKVLETRKRNQRYHESMTRSIRPVEKSSTTSDKASFKRALQSSGGVGVPAVRRQKLTMPVEFKFESDKRAELKKRKASSPPVEDTRPLKRFRA